MNKNYPKGYKRVTNGEIQEGDILWDSKEGWGTAVGGEIGTPVSSYHCVIRK